MAPSDRPPPLVLRFDRRRLLQGASALSSLNLIGLASCAAEVAAPGRPTPTSMPQPRLAPIRASLQRVFDVTVCRRPFRAAGPRLDAETVGDALIVHNYGHGGSGWSLSWGSATQAVKKAMAASPAEIAVVGCGAIGLTSAILAQQAGAKVTIYARELLPDTRSARATGSWTPDSRIALASKVDPGFPALWEEMARTSFHAWRRYLGLPGSPVEWTDRYYLSGLVPGAAQAPPDPALAVAQLDFAGYLDRIRDITPAPTSIPVEATPFPVAGVSTTSLMQFNIADLGHTLLNDFLTAGGRIVRAEFHEPAELGRLREKVVINCPGYGARALWRDETIVPVRGQISWLIPQPEVTYGLYYDGVSTVPRRDGIVLQLLDGGDMRGYGDDHEVPDPAETRAAVTRIAELFAAMKR